MDEDLEKQYLDVLARIPPNYTTSMHDTIEKLENALAQLNKDILVVDQCSAQYFMKYIDGNSSLRRSDTRYKTYVSIRQTAQTLDTLKICYRFKLAELTWAQEIPPIPNNDEYDNIVPANEDAISQYMEVLTNTPERY